MMKTQNQFGVCPGIYALLDFHYKRTNPFRLYIQPNTGSKAFDCSVKDELPRS